MHCFFVFVLLCAAMLNAHPLPEFNINLASRQTLSCTMFSRDSERVLLQNDGNVDDFIEFIVCPTRLGAQYTYVTTSSSRDVLPIDTEHVSLNIIQSDSSSCQNVSVLLIFDNLVGVSTFTLIAIDPETSASACEASTRFTVAGLSFFETPAPSVATESEVVALQETTTVYSGTGNPVLSDYREVLEKRLRSLQVFVQYPDGRSSSSMSVPDLVSSLETIQIISENDATSPVQFDPSCTSVSLVPSSELSANCGAAFSIQDDGEPLVYGLRYVPYKDGTTKLNFLWPSFTERVVALSGDQFETSLSISVLGDPPPLIESFEPQRSFWRSGGEKIIVTYDNINTSMKRRLQVGEFTFQEVPGSLRLLENGLYAAEYISAPGSGVDLDLNLEVDLEDGTTVQSVAALEATQFSYKTSLLSIDTIDPPFALAGNTVTITGYFDGFDPSNLDHKLLIGTKPLSSLGIVPKLSEDRQSITFQLPDRDEIGAAYEFPISFAINTENSTSVDFAFVPDTPLLVLIRVLGASYNPESDQYELGSCDPSEYIAELPNGISDPEVFKWNMTAVDDPMEHNFLEGNNSATNRTSKELRIPPTVFGGRTGAFVISVECQVNSETLVDSVVVLKTQAPVIGVTLISQNIRGIASPNVPVRVSAQIVTPPNSCYNRLSPVVYEWIYGGNIYIRDSISSSEIQDVTEPTVGLLGREFVLPQSFLTYGNHSVSLVAYIRDDLGINGSSTTSFEVKPIGLTPVIGNGASFLVHDGKTNLQVTSENTICPDCAVLGRQMISKYLWTCRLSTKLEDLDEGSLCTMRFLPNPEATSFSVSSQALFRQGNSNALHSQSDGPNRFFLRYTLQVGANSVLSDEAIQTIEVITEENGVATLTGIDIFDNRGRSLNMWSLPFYEDILIVPRSVDNVSWTIAVISSSLRSDVLSDTKNIILLDRYYDPTSNRSQKYPLGIKAFALLPYERYTMLFNISSSNTLVRTSQVTLSVRTKDRPKLVLPDMLLDTATTEDVFSVWAGVNLDASYPFLFFFFAVDVHGREQCLDGCSGSSTIQFRLPVAGKFRILVRLRDVHGSVLLDEAYFPGILSVSDSSTVASPISDLKSTAQFATELERAGDHGTILLLTSMISSVQNSWVSESFTDSDRSMFSSLIGALEEIVNNSIPSTSRSKSFVVAAVRLASVRPEYISLSGLNSLLSIVNSAVRRVPAEEFYDHELELKVFYNLSIAHSLRLHTGIGNEETLQSGHDESDNVRSVVARIFRLLREQLTIVLSRDAHCGAIKRFNTILHQNGATAAIIGNETILVEVLRQVTGSFDFLETYEAPWKPKHAIFSMAVSCFRNQVKEMRGETASFKWCEESVAFFLRDDEQARDFRFTSKLLFSLLETMDYQFFTGAIGQESDSVFVLNSSIAHMSSRGVNDVILPRIPTCFQLNMSVLTLGITPYRGCLSADGYSIAKFSNHLENKQTSLVRNFTEVETYTPKDRSSTIALTSATTGTFGATGVDCPANARRPQVQTPEFDIEFGYLAFGGALVGVVGVAVSWVTSSSSYAALVGTAAAA
eukprot:TRINITY_DN458_c0_g1_i1.p1 TRINITY_DN458_c0_g1~~TRINITY_DN458_c0_g1_i1.p1  ORF type:complete len:1555 (-),score=174.64 TRINITY_DN458_c0_g1_i1:24689-29353(-)